MRTAIATLALALTGCLHQNPLPQTYSVSESAFGPERTAVIHDVVAALCASDAQWCMTEVDGIDADLRFTADWEYETRGRGPDSFAYFQQDLVRVNPHHFAWDDMALLWVTVAHEAVHACDMSHVPVAGHLMSAHTDPDNPPAMVIDSDTARFITMGCDR